MIRTLMALAAFALTIATLANYMGEIKRNVETVMKDVETVKGDIETVMNDVEIVKKNIDGVKNDVVAVKDNSNTIKSNTDDIKRVQGRVQQALSSFGQPDSFGRYKWENGDDPVEMIGSNEGLCYLVFVKGPFEGDHESVSIYMNNNTWFLQGDKEGKLLNAEAQCWKFPVIQQ